MQFNLPALQSVHYDVFYFLTILTLAHAYILIASISMRLNWIHGWKIAHCHAWRLPTKQLKEAIGKCAFEFSFRIDKNIDKWKRTNYTQQAKSTTKRGKKVHAHTHMRVRARSHSCLGLTWKKNAQWKAISTIFYSPLTIFSLFEIKKCV